MTISCSVVNFVKSTNFNKIIKSDDCKHMFYSLPKTPIGWQHVTGICQAYCQMNTGHLTY